MKCLAMVVAALIPLAAIAQGPIVSQRSAVRPDTANADTRGEPAKPVVHPPSTATVAKGPTISPSGGIGAAGSTMVNGEPALGSYAINGATGVGEFKGLRAIGAMTAPSTDSSINTFQNGARTARQIYGRVIPPEYHFSDNIRSVISSEPGMAVQHMSAFGGYTYNGNATGAAPTERNVVGLWIDGVNAVDGAATWGINTACIDNVVNGLAPLVGRRCIGWEADFEVNGASTISGAGLIIQGAGTPKNADGFLVNRTPGATATWTNAFISADGAATTAMIVGAQATTGADVGSQPIVFNYRDSMGIVRGLKLAARHAALTINSTAATEGLYFEPGDAKVTVGIAGSKATANFEIRSGPDGAVMANGSPVLTGAKAKLAPTMFAALPVCDAAADGMLAYVADARAAITAWHQHVTAGGGRNKAFVACNGMGWFAFSY